MDLLAAMHDLGHERVMLHRDSDARYRAVIALHSTVLGPAVGGTRLWQYASTEAALLDALHLSRGMTYKAALAGLPLGGGKAVIFEPAAPGFDRRALFRAHGRAVDALAGRFVTAEDVGTTPEDMDEIHAVTAHVAGLSHRSGNPAPSTARGVFRALQAAAHHRWGSERLEGRRILIQGCGQVGSDLARRLAAAGATLLVTDTSPERVRECARRYSATAVDPDRFASADADVLAPCALGQVLNDLTIPRLRAAIVVGAANNQLAAPEHADLLERRGILYVPDYVANAGGLIGGTVELLDWSVQEARRRIDGIFDTVRALLELADREGLPPARAADRFAEARLRGDAAAAGRGLPA